MAGGISAILQLFGDLRHPLNGEGRIADGLHGDGHELDGVVVRRTPVGAERAAPAAAVDDRPFAVFPNPHSHRLHQSAAVRCPVARFNVQMHGTQAVGAMVPVVAPRARRDDGIAAVPAGEPFLAGVSLKIAFYVLISFIIPVH